MTWVVSFSMLRLFGPRSTGDAPRRQELPGEFTTFDFIPGIPAPFNFGLAILLNQKMLTLGEKLQTAPPLLPMLVEGQEFIDAQDELSVLDLSLIHI